MASSDSSPLPLKNQALQISFGLWLTTGLINTGASGLDSEISKDNGTFADCTNEATEVATASGTYYLDLTSTEMNADVVCIQVKSSTTNAITYKITIYPSSLGKIQVDVRSLLGTAWLAPGTAGTPDVNAKFWNALPTVALPLVPTTAGRTLDVSTGGEAGVDWANVGSPTTSQALTGTTIATTQKVDVETIKTQAVTCAGGVTIPAATLASTINITAGTITTVTNLTNAPAVGDLTATMKASVTIAATAATPTVTAGTVSDKTGYALTGAYDAAKTAAQVSDIPTATQVADALLKRDFTAVTGEASRSMLNSLRFIRNGFSISGTTLTVLKEDDTTAAYTRTLTTDAGAAPITGVA